MTSDEEGFAMLCPDHIDGLPFPVTLRFQDVAPEVLHAEDDAENSNVETPSWLAFMRRVLPRDARVQAS